VREGEISVQAFDPVRWPTNGIRPNILISDGRTLAIPPVKLLRVARTAPPKLPLRFANPSRGGFCLFYSVQGNDKVI
jgi:hypothetical protein